MVDLLDISLANGLKKELKGNRLAILLYRNVESRKIFDEPRSNIAQSFIGGYSEESTDYEPKTDKATINRFQDLRFRYLTLCNIKKYPDKINDCLYGVSFEKENVPVHSVFLGSNGVGKTSLYAALEYLGMRKMNTAIERGYNRLIGQVPDKHGELVPDQKEFLLRPGMGIKDSSIGLYCNQQVLQLEGDQITSESSEKLVCDSFFCSAYDVEQLERCRDFGSFFVNQTGLSDYYSCLQSLYYLHRYLEVFETEEDESVSLKVESQEAISRLQLGIVFKEAVIGEETFAETVYLEDICDINFSERPLEESKDLLEDSLQMLRDEVVKMSPASWFVLPTIQKYEKVIQTIESIKGELDEGIFSLYHEKVQFLKNFNSFRSVLKSSVIVTQKEVDNSEPDGNSESVDSKISLYDSYMSELLKFNIQKTKEDSERYIDSSFNSGDRKQFKKDLNALIEYLENYLSRFVLHKENKIKESIENLLSDTFALDNDSVNIDIAFKPFLKGGLPITVIQNKNVFVREYKNKDVHEFIKFDVKILSSRGNLNSEERVAVDPRSYLNTFRYKLFCVALKLVFLCISKALYNINFPFVIDDVFDSSDFDSRLKLNDFTKKLIEIHNKLLPEDRYVLQLIFFTQDDLIANQVYKGLVSKVEKKNVKFSQIFDYHECDNNEDLRNFKLADNQKVISYLTESQIDNDDKSSSSVDTCRYVSVEDIIE